MATKIVTKNSSTAGAAPTATDLVQGELAVNVADKRLFTEDNAGAIVELGTNPSELTVNGIASVSATNPKIQLFETDTTDLNTQIQNQAGEFKISRLDDDAGSLTVHFNIDHSTGNVSIPNGNIALPDNGKATFGAGDDLQIYHDGSDSVIAETGVGNLALWGNNIKLLNAGGTETMLDADPNGAVTLYYNDVTRLATSGAGIDVTGTATMGGLVTQAAANTYPAGAAQIKSLAGDISYITNVSGNFLISNSSTTDQFVLSSAGNVGIGTSSPSNYSAVGANRLVVGTNVGSNGITIVGGTTGYASLAFADSVGSGGNDDYAGLIQYSHITNGMNFFTNSTQKMVLDSAGNLLVGTTSAAVSSSTGSVTGTVINSTGLFEAARDGTIMELNRVNTDGILLRARKNGAAVGSIGTSSADGFYIHSTFGNDSGLVFGSERIVPCTSTGAFDDAAVDLGYSSGRFKDLHLSGAAYIPDVRSTGIQYFTHTTDARFRTATGTERMRIDSAGRLLHQTTSSTSYPTTSVYAMFGVGGDATLKLGGYGGSHTMIQFLYAGNNSVGTIISTATSTSYNTSSDQRLKENIADADDAGSKIDAIQVRKYDWKADGSHQDYGMIAQELQAVAPEAVSGDADSEEMMGVDYSKLVPMLIKEIQSLRNRVAQLETGE